MPPATALRRVPLSEDKQRLLAGLTEGLDSADLWWLSGFAAGLAQRGQVVSLPPEPLAEVAADDRLTILYGSQTGNAKNVAERLAQQAREAGVVVRLVRADAYPQRELASERLLYIVISTQGDGDPPDDARGLVEFLASRRAPKLPGLQFAVLGLGDSSYPQFCAMARRLDERLAELGAKRLFERGEADLDIDTVAVPWAQRALETAREALKPRAHLASVTPLRAPAAAVATREHPLEAEVLTNQRITASGSTKDVRHIELSLQGVDYEPGDALGVWPRNPPLLVEQILQSVKLDAAASVSVDGATHTLREWLESRREITRLSRPFVAALAKLGGDAGLQGLLQPESGESLRVLLESLQPIDLLLRHPAPWSAQALVAALRPLTPRLYSIASARAAVGDEAHLTVGHIAYETAAGPRWGAASHWLASRAEGQAVQVYLERNERFRLPTDASRDIIMIGPGTGIAPFRGFVQQRAAAAAGGRNWLLFGNPHRRDDFLYQLEWQAALKDGSLHRLDVAFSRDQEEKVYVQQRVRENGRELFAWLENGAHLYVCGATAMARDVEGALRDVIVAHGARTPEAAGEYIAALREHNRYARDIY
jgi:sulfite reductase (NADPH) flavoprotein alpha-component